MYRFYKAFEGPVDAAHAAAAVGLETEALLERFVKSRVYNVWAYGHSKVRTVT